MHADRAILIIEHQRARVPGLREARDPDLVDEDRHLVPVGDLDRQAHALHRAHGLGGDRAHLVHGEAECDLVIDRFRANADVGDGRAQRVRIVRQEDGRVRRQYRR